MARFVDQNWRDRAWGPPCRATESGVTSLSRPHIKAVAHHLFPPSLHPPFTLWPLLTSSRWVFSLMMSLYSSSHPLFAFAFQIWTVLCMRYDSLTSVVYFVFSWCLYTALIYTAVCNTGFRLVEWKLLWLITSNILWLMLYLLNFYDFCDWFWLAVH
jgi:hypothetical protein